ncbi:MAG: SGNH hydrolase domain-containing protein [Candidatus Limnocylindrales bacterium]
MTHGTGRARWRLALASVLALALLPAPSSAADGAPDTGSALERLGQATAAVPGGANAIALATTVLGLLGGAIDAIDEGPWVPAAHPHALPLNLTPPLPDAAETKSRAYTDGCHALPNVRKARPCSYGDRDSDFDVLLMGDSHAAMWLPALEEIADRRGWQIHLLTKSACPPARISVLFRRKVYAACDAWRRSAFKVAQRIKPDLAIVTSTVGYAIDGVRRRYSKPYLAAWRKGWSDTMRTLGRSAGEVVVLNDGPEWATDPLRCLRRHADDVRACATPRHEAMREDVARTLRRAAEAADATFVDSSELICPEDPCQVVDGRYLVAYDISHLTPVYARLLSERLEAMLTDEGE